MPWRWSQRSPAAEVTMKLQQSLLSDVFVDLFKCNSSTKPLSGTSLSGKRHILWVLFEITMSEI